MAENTTNMATIGDKNMIIINDKFKTLLPQLPSDQMAGLEQDILKNGCLTPLITWQGILIDGHHRYTICQKHSLPFKKQEMQFNSETEAMYWCWLNQKNRRNLSAYELGRMALVFEPVIRAKAKINQGIRTDISQKSVKSLKPVDTQKEIAKIAGVSHDTIAKIKIIEAKAPDEMKTQLSRQEISINKAYEQLRHQEQRQERIAKIAEISKHNAALNLPQKYAVIYADPPWRYSHDGIGSGSRPIENHYPTMELEAIKALPVKNITMPDAILFLWSTSPMLEQAIEVVKAWDFNYKTCAIWDKQIFGMGSYFRQQHEILLVARRGNIPAPEPQNCQS